MAEKRASDMDLTLTSQTQELEDESGLGATMLDDTATGSQNPDLSQLMSMMKSLMAETSKISAENAKTSAENADQLAKISKETAETSTISAETSKLSRETAHKLNKISADSKLMCEKKMRP